LVSSNYYCDACAGWFDNSYGRYSCCPIRLHFILGMYILGISAYYHDSAACLIEDGEIIAAVQEERFTRVKHDSRFPSHAITYCLNEAGITTSNNLDYVVFYDKPFVKFERLLETYLAFAPRGFKSFVKSMPVWFKDKLFQKSTISKELTKLLGKDVEWNKRLLFSEHHLSHAASAFFPSPFEEAAVLTMDGVGEWTTTSLAIGKGNSLSVHKEIHFPHSLGLLYSAFTYYTGFKVNSGEYKVMGLAPYGEPTFVNTIKDNLIDIKEDGSFQLNMSYFDYCTELTMTNKRFNQLFGGPPREAESELTQREMDLAASIQKVTEEVIIKLAKGIAKETHQKNLCLAGGVALNCVANGVLLREKIFKNIWIQPAAGDAGGSLGAALGAYFIMLGKVRTVNLDSMRGAYLGPNFTNDEIKKYLTECGANYRELDDEAVINETAKGLADGKAIGWMNGRMEFGPRSLGGRSIIADPRSPLVQKTLNLKVKYRESFRPFAPSVLKEDASEWFEIDVDSPYMLIVADVVKNKRRKISDEEKSLFGIDKLNVPRSEIPAVTHVDYTARIQTVHKETNPRYHAVLLKFKELTGCSVLVNTSFNVRGEPIVCTPKDAFRCFMGTELDLLVIGNMILHKQEQSVSLKESYKEKYKLD
jgi:carbamoyltransferase